MFVLVPPQSTPSFGVLSNYSGVLTITSSTYTRFGSTGRFYYEVITFDVPTSGDYYIQSDSSVDAFGYVYLHFDPIYPSQNIIAMNDDSAGNLQFSIYYRFESNKIYTLIMTTATPSETGSFSIFVRGQAIVNFHRLTTTLPTTRQINLLVSSTFRCTYMNFIEMALFYVYILASVSTSTQLKMNMIIFIAIRLFIKYII